MQFKLGAVGVGHWFERLYVGITKTNKIVLEKVASASGVEKKREQLKRLGIPENNYYMVNGEKPLSEKFFEGLDIVHISDPNEFHAGQTLQSLYNDKITITEKTFGISHEEFMKVMDYIKDSGKERKVYLHLHYANKTLTRRLATILKEFVPKYGKIKKTFATFFEIESEEDQRRSTWLFAMKSGGLFMDWIHPFEIYRIGADAKKFKLDDVHLYSINGKYDSLNPTGVEAVVKIKGDYFTEDATAVIRLAKGVKKDKDVKSVRFIFEDGKVLDINYVGTNVENSSENRGNWELKDEKGNVLESENPHGKASADVLVEDLLKLCDGKKAGLTYKDISMIYDPQWQYHKLSENKELVKNSKDVERFIRNGSVLS